MNIKLPLRNVALQRRRYYLIVGAIAFGFAVMTLLSGASRGLLDSMKEKAARYFSGHVDVRNFARGTTAPTDPGPALRLLRERGLGIVSASARTVAYGGEVRLFFGGESSAQRRIVGVDFSVEAPRFASMPFAAGGAGGMEGGGGVLISEQSARAIGARLGDDVTVFYQAAGGGPINTVTAEVRGVFRETSLFGYAAYLEIGDVDSLLGYPEGSATDLAIYLGSPAEAPGAAEAIRSALSDRFRVLPPLASREDLDRLFAAGVDWEPTLGVLSVDAQLSQFSQLMAAIGYATWISLAVFAAIVAVGIMNSYRMIMAERMREMGTMRAIGMSRPALRLMFVFEAFAVTTAGVALGLVAGNILLAALGLADFSWIPGSGLFLDSGRLRFAFDGREAFRNYLAMAAIACAAAAGPVFKASRVPPVTALRGA